MVQKMERYESPIESISVELIQFSIISLHPAVVDITNNVIIAFGTLSKL